MSPNFLSRLGRAAFRGEPLGLAMPGPKLGDRLRVVLSGPVTQNLSGSRLVCLGILVGGASLLVTVGSLVRAQAPSASRPTFDVASIKRNPNCGNLPLTAGATLPGRLTKQCMAVESWIIASYVSFADGRTSPISPGRVPIEGAPGWVRSELYDLQAQVEGNPSQATMNGPMMQALLEDRLKLKLHFETREIPVYALTVKDAAKMKPFQEGSCTPMNVNTLAPRGEGQPPLCGFTLSPSRTNRNIIVLEQRGATMEELAERLSLAMDRNVVDRSGLKGRFDVYLEFAPDQTTPRFLPNGVPPTEPGSGAWIFTAIQEQLGLKLESAKGPGRFIVIEHIERPTEN